MKSVSLHNRLNSILAKGLALILFFSFSLTSYSQDVDVERHKKGKTLFKSLLVQKVQY